MRGMEGYPFGASQSDVFWHFVFIKQQTIWEIVFLGNLSKSLVWTKTARLSMRLQSHKSVSAKSQVCDCDCKVGKRPVPMQLSKVMNYSTCMIVVRAQPNRTLWGILCQRFVRVKALCETWKERVFKACDCMWQTSGWLIRGTSPF